MICLILLLTLGIFSANAQVSCPSGFKYFNNNQCIKYFYTESTHRDAEKQCTSLGGTLVIINNAIDNRAILQYLTSQSANSNVWIGAFCFSSNFANCYNDLDSRSPTPYTNFDNGSPLPDGLTNSCVSMDPSNGKWFIKNCHTEELPFICQVPPMNYYSSECSIAYEDNCYEVVPSAKDHNTALKNCRKGSMNLLSIHSMGEHDYLRNVLRTNYSTVHRIYIGATVKMNNISWDDGSDYDFDYSIPLLNTSSGCMVLDKAGSGLWLPTKCDLEWSSICKWKPDQAHLQIQKTSKIQKTPEIQKTVTLDSTNCNSTLFIAPGYITSTISSTSCSYSVRALGPYSVSIVFTEFNIGNGEVSVYGDTGALLERYTQDQKPFSVYSPSNIMNVVYTRYDQWSSSESGFTAKLIPSN